MERIGKEHLVAERGVSAASGEQVERPLSTLEIPFSDIEAGWATSPDGRWFAELRLRSGMVLSVVVADRELAQEIVAACRVGPNRRALRMKLGGTTHWLTIAYPGLLVGILPCWLGAYLLVDLVSIAATARSRNGAPRSPSCVKRQAAIAAEPVSATKSC